MRDVTSNESRVTSNGFFVTGTDTGVGKTLVACALLRAYAGRGMMAVGMKPVAAGAAPGAHGLRHADVESLMAAGNVVVPREHVNPYCFALPIAPHIAARQAGVTISLDRIVESFRVLAARAQMVVVEGAGGFRVPLGPGLDTVQLAARLGLPVVLVVGMRLGCLNHALLTADAIAARGLPLAGWIANHIDPGMIAADDNVRTLEALIAAPLIARIAHAVSPDPAVLAGVLQIGKLP